MSIYNIRYENALDIAKRVGGQSKFAERMGMSRQQANHVLGARNKAGSKNIGEALARRIETVFDMPSGWLDVNHRLREAHKHDPEWIEVPLLSSVIGAPAAHDVACSMTVAKDWVRKNTAATAFDHLALVTAQGDAMTPTFEPESVLMVDRGVTTVADNAVYVFVADDALQVRRVQRKIDGGLVVLCDNPRYAPEEISPKDRAKLMIVARVLTAFEPRKV